MSDALKLVEAQIEAAEGGGDAPHELQRLYVRREKLQEKEFRDSLRRRARLQKTAK